MATPDRENSSTDPRFTPSPSGSSVGVQTPFDRQGAWSGSVGLDRPRLTRSGGNRATRPPDPLRPRRSLATLGFRLAVGSAPWTPARETARRSSLGTLRHGPLSAAALYPSAVLAGARMAGTLAAPLPLGVQGCSLPPPGTMPR